MASDNVSLYATGPNTGESGSMLATSCCALLPPSPASGASQTRAVAVM
jgi:hypothetical protein